LTRYFPFQGTNSCKIDKSLEIS